MNLRIGFVPLADCAPLVVALEHGHFAAQGLEVELSKAQSWEQARSKLERGDYQAAHLLATLPLLSALGIDGSRSLLSTAWTISQSGNAITLSNRLCKAGATDGPRLARFLEESGSPERIRLGIVHSRSTHELMLREWLAAGDLEIGERIELVVSPPQEMVRRLRDGELDGFCAGEPWNQRASTSKLGGVVALGEDVVAPGTEKVLAVSRPWHDEHHETHAKILRALDAASRWLADESHLDEAAALVAGKRFVNTQEGLLRDALHRRIRAGWGRTLEGRRFLRFSGHGCNAPDARDFRWYLERLVLWGIAQPQDLDLDLDKICLAGFHRGTFPLGDGMDRIFAFEADFADGLRCIPMVVRRKLDLVGIKLSLAQWSRFSVEARAALAEGPLDTPDLRADWKSRMEAAIRLHAGEEPRFLPVEEAPSWTRLDAIPPEVAEWSTGADVALSIARWRSLDELQRFALTKLSRAGHENRNFLPACKEFGIT